MAHELKVYMDSDIDKNKILNKKVAVIGYGSQGYGQSTNLKDSGVDVVIGARVGGASAKKAQAEGLKVMSIEDAVKWADLIQILIPDEVQAKVYEEQIKPNLRAGQYLMFAHGFNIHFKKIVPPADVNVLMVAPKARDTLLEANTLQAKAFLLLLLFIRILQEIQKKLHWLMHLLLVQAELVFMKLLLKKKLKQTCLVNRQFFAVVYQH